MKTELTNLRTSGLGAVTKKNVKWRRSSCICLHLTASASMTTSIRKTSPSNDAVAMVTEYGKECIKAKIDLKAAFRMVPIVAEEWDLLGFQSQAQHKLWLYLSPASNNPMIKFLVQGVERSMPAAHLKPKRQPITNEMVGQMLSQLDRDHKPSHDCLMLKAAVTLGFFGLLRDITMRRDSMVVVIKKSKTDQKAECCQINIGTALTARALRLVLHHLIRRCGYSTELYNTHSLRIGAATAAARSGLPPATIRNLGR
eukprot:Em0024g33a